LCSKQKIMTTIALKKYLVEKINLLEDDVVLKQLKKVVQKNEKVYELSEFQINLVNEAREDIKNGNFISKEDMDKKVEAWAKRK
jgi:hypothetical protein